MCSYKPPTMEDVRASSNRELFTVISTFAGAGGSSTGYRLAGGKVLAVNEFIKAARETYAANYPDVAILPGDVRSLTGAEALEKAGIAKGELDILDGSPPCASFSMAGKREKHWGSKKKYSETTQRTDDLFFEFARLVDEIRPRVFVGENVEGLALGKALDLLGTKQSGLFGEHEETILFHLEKLGYRVGYKVLNSADYGVPQTRKRLIFVGVRADLGREPVFPKRILTPDKWMTLLDAIGELEQDPAEIKAAEIPERYKVREYIDQLKPGQSGSDINEKGSYFSLSRLEWSKPVGTVQQSHGSPGIATNMVHPDLPRKLSIPELKRVSSFPDDFELTGTFEQRWERIGRAVPPLMMKAIAETIYKEILEPAREGRRSDPEAQAPDFITEIGAEEAAREVEEGPEEEELPDGPGDQQEMF